MMSKGIFNIQVEISNYAFVMFHNPQTLVQYANTQDLDWTGEDSKARPKIVRRGLSEELYAQIPQGKLYIFAVLYYFLKINLGNPCVHLIKGHIIIKLITSFGITHLQYK